MQWCKNLSLGYAKYDMSERKHVIAMSVKSRESRTRRIKGYLTQTNFGVMRKHWEVSGLEVHCPPTSVSICIFVPVMQVNRVPYLDNALEDGTLIVLVHALINLVYDPERNLNHILQREDKEHDAQRFLASGLDIRVQKLQVLLRT